MYSILGFDRIVNLGFYFRDKNDESKCDFVKSHFLKLSYVKTSAITILGKNFYYYSLV